MTVLFLATGLIVSVSSLAFEVGADAFDSVLGWVGARQTSNWGQVGLAKHQLKLTRRDLMIAITGDKLTARYTLTAPAKYSSAAEALIDANGDAGEIW